jgi:AICAR transformylase/IMP cyclohydrolase PurH
VSYSITLIGANFISLSLPPINPGDYFKILKEMKATGGSISEITNFFLAAKAFQLTAR